MIRFNQFEIDVDGFKLRQNGHAVDVEPLVFDLIVLLATNHGRVVTKDEITEKIWNGRFVSDTAISTAIKSARKVLGDTGNKQRIIKTAWARGFEFVGTLAETETALVEPAPSAVSTATETSLRQDISFVVAEDDTQIAVASIGKGPVVLRAAHWLSHISLDANSPVFKHWFSALSKEHHFVRYDLRGSGLSDRDVDDISFEAFARDLDAVADTIDEPFTLFGMSQGGPLCIDYAVRHPERVKRVVLFGAYTRGMAVRARSERDRVEAETLQNLMLLGWGSDNPAFNQVFTNLFIPGGSHEQHSWWRDLEHQSASPENAARIFRANSKIDVLDLAAQISVPTLVFHCRNDRRVPFEEGRKLAAVIPDAHFVPLESANHVLLEQEPAWNTFLTEFKSFMAAS